MRVNVIGLAFLKKFAKNFSYLCKQTSYSPLLKSGPHFKAEERKVS